MNLDMTCQRQLLEQIIQEIDEAILVVDSSGVIKLCNEQVFQVLGMSASDVAGAVLDEIMPGLHLIEHSSQAYLIPEREQIINVKVRILDDESQEKLYLLVLSRGDQDRERATLLRKAYEVALDNIDEGLIIVDGEGRIVYLNQVQLEFDELKMKEINGRYTWDVYQFNREISTLLKVLETGQSFGDYVHYYITNGGQYVRVTGNNFPVTIDGKVVGAVAVYRNLKKSEEMVGKIIELQKKLHQHQMEQGMASFDTGSKKKYYTFDDILGESEHIQEALSWARRAAVTESPVLLLGETGTGKEMFAQSIHAASNRSKNPFIAINCAAIPESLLEGILFGSVKGVYTGANDHKGLFEEADTGTLFLDEINSMSLNLQSKLLRVLEERKVRRLGGKTEIPVDVRLISSCNLEPNREITSQLRSDLFFRLAVVTIKIPPLRIRRNDIKLLVEYYINYFNELFGKKICAVSPKIEKFLKDYSWPGNVRQLKHWVECAMNLVPENENILDENYTPKEDHIFNFNNNKPQEKIEDGPYGIKYRDIVNQIKEQECIKIKEMLERHKGNITKAAHEMGMSRQSLLYRLRKYGMK
ncbi:sigma-54 interaction domain-containing protein [Candidatus Formimonas warabiya]|uniref:sigma-54 interaction domain-containing protein n=1 Tax=Formimonas warabiya TaxID=1761012 RepID=UPI001F02CFAF|nr:sigma 54-interacting transcriptional regulator [Candidatus Formimonas warabiya]